MGYGKYIDDLIERALMDMHTAYIGKVLSVGENQATATVQPLGYNKQYGKSAQKKAIVSGVPVIQSARNRITPSVETVIENVSIATETKDGYIESATPNITTKKITTAQFKPLSVGDIVVCICCERDISSAKNGIDSMPATGHHSISDTVIVGVL